MKIRNIVHATDIRWYKREWKCSFVDCTLNWLLDSQQIFDLSDDVFRFFSSVFNGEIIFYEMKLFCFMFAHKWWFKCQWPIFYLHVYFFFFLSYLLCGTLCGSNMQLIEKSLKCGRNVKNIYLKLSGELYLITNLFADKNLLVSLLNVMVA